MSAAVSLGIPVSSKAPRLNKSQAERAGEQEVGSQRNLTSLDQLEKKLRGTKNVTPDPRWVWLVNREDGKLKAGVRLHFFQVVQLLLLFPLSQPPPTERQAGEVCQPPSQGTMPLLSFFFHRTH